MKGALFRTAAAALVLAALGSSGCTSDDAERRAREAAEEIRSQLVDPQERALSQEAPPERVREAQEHLTTLREYLGVVNGEIDAVTVNAVEAFQSAHDLESDGLLTDETMERLRAAAEKKKAG